MAHGSLGVLTKTCPLVFPKPHISNFMLSVVSTLDPNNILKQNINQSSSYRPHFRRIGPIMSLHETQKNCPKPIWLCTHNN